MSNASTVSALVHTLRHEADGIISVELRPWGDTVFAPFEAGAHIDLHLPNGLVRSYSLLNSPANRAATWSASCATAAAAAARATFTSSCGWVRS
jgi:Flavodoxin reductases (ferredoxin-NADPH reductases) family 1